ncbi:hypothetical protein [Facilibium subflavum]|uniref:hypothetical protein n=1 Tax=Facilibium subflavum TaxID=2219058 RepID=UPI000E659107|nr:hypothetical protein [Facilibium subflavum]
MKPLQDKDLFASQEVNRSYLSDLMVSIHRSGFKTTLISIVWTAGPITVVAILLGYYFSHGTVVPFSTLIYFSIYVFIVGLSGLISKIILDTIRMRNQERSEQAFLNVIETAYDKLRQARNLKFAALAQNAKQEMISAFLLSKSHPSTTEIYVAMQTHFSEKAARFAELMQIYENNGIPADACKFSVQLHEIRQEIISQEHLSENFKYLALRKIEGDHISLNEGVSRNPGFLTKVLNSGGQLSLFDTDDASDIITLSLELLAGRTIYFFKTITNFDHLAVEKLFKQIETTRQKIRLKHWLAYGLVEQIYFSSKALSPELPLKNLIHIQKDAPANLHLMQQAIKEIHFNDFNKDTRQKLKNLIYRFEQTTNTIYSLIKRLDALMLKWHKLENTPQNILDDQKVQVKLASIQLEEKSRLALAQQLQDFTANQSTGDTEKDIKAYALYIVKCLIKPLNLENPLIIYAIEVSNAANFSCVEANYSAKQKAELTHNLSKTVYANIRQLKKRFRENLIAQYQYYKMD